MTEEKKVIHPTNFQKLPGNTSGLKQIKTPTKREVIQEAQQNTNRFEQQLKGYQQILQSIAKKQHQMEQSFNQNFLQYDVISLALRNVVKELGVSEEQWMKAIKEASEVIREQQEQEFDTRNGFVTVKREAQKGDFVAIVFVGKINDKEFPGGTSHFHLIEVGKGQFLPEMEESFVGKKRDDEYNVTVVFPENYQAKELVGETAIFEVKILAVKERKQKPIAPEQVAKPEATNNVENKEVAENVEPVEPTEEKKD